MSVTHAVMVGICIGWVQSNTLPIPYSGLQFNGIGADHADHPPYRHLENRYNNSVIKKKNLNFSNSLNILVTKGIKINLSFIVHPLSMIKHIIRL